MSSFTDPLLVEITQKQRHERALAKIIKEFRYHVGAYPSNDVIIVPVGYETDFASIPAVATWFLPVLGKSAKAAVIHDFLLDQGERENKECARIFLEAMTVLGVGLIKRTLMYYSVKWYGNIKYAKNGKKKN